MFRHLTRLPHKPMPTYPSYISVLVLLAAVAACEARPADKKWEVSIRGYGPIAVGMTLAEASAAGGRALGQPGAGMESCDIVGFAGDTAARPGVRFIVVDGHIARVEVFDSTIATTHGARIGDAEATIERLYPRRVTVTPHKYTEGHYLMVAPRDSTDSGFELVFETEGGRVTQYRAGRLPEVEYVEGCS